MPATFVAGQRYSLTITLTRTGMQRGGFQLAARFKSNGAQAGTSRLLPSTHNVWASKARAASNTSVRRQRLFDWHWRHHPLAIEWIAPERAEAVVFHLAANAADGNGSADGDLVYTTSAESIPPP